MTRILPPQRCRWQSLVFSFKTGSPLQSPQIQERVATTEQHLRTPRPARASEIMSACLAWLGRIQVARPRLRDVGRDLALSRLRFQALGGLDERFLHGAQLCLAAAMLHRDDIRAFDELRKVEAPGYGFAVHDYRAASAQSLPATFTPDMWAHQYDQQVNQVECSIREGARIVQLVTYKGVTIHILDETSWMATGSHKSNDGCLTSSLCRTEGAGRVAFESGASRGS